MCFSLEKAGGVIDFQGESKSEMRPGALLDRDVVDVAPAGASGGGDEN